MTKLSEFSIVWKPHESISPTGRWLPNPVSFPFLLDGKRDFADKSAGAIALSPRDLIFGILLQYHDPSPYTQCASPEQLSATLHDLVPVLGAPSLESATLDASAYLRESYGLAVGRVALTTASIVVPASAMIRSDLITICWSLLKSLPMGQRELALQQICANFRADDLPNIDAQAAQMLVFAYLTALCVLPGGFAAKQALLSSRVLELITHSWYIPRVQYLLATESPSLECVLEQVASSVEVN